MAWGVGGVICRIDGTYLSLHTNTEVKRANRVAEYIKTVIYC